MSPIQTGSRLASSHLDELVEWEEAARILDLEPGIVSRLRQPKLELTYRIPTTFLEPVTLFIAADEISGVECAAFVELGPEVSREKTVKHFWQVSAGSILTALNGRCASVGIRIPANFTERELWMLSREVASIVTRTLGAYRIVPSDLKSSVFAGWMAHAPLSSGERLETSRLTPQLYWERQSRIAALAMVQWCALALEEKHKELRGATAIVLGCSSHTNALVRRLLLSDLRFVGIADDSGGLMTEGVDLQQVLAHLDADGLIAEFAGGEHALASGVAQLGCDLALVEPRMYAALEVEPRLGPCPIIVAMDDWECAGPVHDHEMVVLPALFLDCLTLLSEFDHVSPDENDLLNSLQGYVRSLWSELKATRTRFAVQNRTATLLLILQRLAQRERLRHP